MKTIAKMMLVSVGSLALLSSGYAFGYAKKAQGNKKAKMVMAECVTRGQNHFTLKYYGDLVSNQMIPLKQQLRQSCDISPRQLKNISKVSVTAKTLTKKTDIWISGDKINSRFKTIKSKDVAHLAGNKRQTVSFNIKKLTEGALKVLLIGDAKLGKVVVETKQKNGGFKKIEVFNLACASKDKQYKVCPVAGILEASLVKKLSNAGCYKGFTYWVSEKGIHVNHGCRAIFKVIAKKKQNNLGGNTSVAKRIKKRA